MIALGISSLYPIDLTAAAYALVFERQPCHLFINDVALLPTTSANRAHSARGALPLPGWEWDSDGTWYQLHAPLLGGTDASFESVLLMSAQQVAAVLDRGGDAVAASRCLAHAKALRGQAARLMRGRDSGEWPMFLSSVAVSLLDQITEVKPLASEWSALRHGANGRFPTNAMLHRLLRPLRPGHGVRFRRGGFVEFSAEGKACTRYDNAWCVDNALYRFYGDDGRNAIEVALDALVEGHMPARCGGPMELELLADVGALIHLPWYASGHLRVENGNLEGPDGWEYISPVTCVDARRVSRRFGGEGLRVDPGGYSLLDYREPETLALSQGLLGLTKLTWEDLADWRALANAYPRTDERLAKSQASARSYVDMRTKEGRALSKGAAEPMSWDAIAGSVTFTSRGAALLELLRGIGELRAWFNPFVARVRDPCAFPLPELAEAGVLRMARLTEVMREMYEACVDGLVRYGCPSAVVLGGQIDFERGLREMQSRTWPVAMPESTTRTGWERNNGLGLIAQAMRTLCADYYGFAGFFTGTVLKAHLYWLYLLFGPIGTRRAIERILAQREQPRLAFNLDVVEYASRL